MTTTTHPHSKWFYILLAVLAASLFPWLLASWVALFAFDAPGSGKNVGIWIFVITLWCYPLVTLPCVICGLVLKLKDRVRGAIHVLLIPLGMAALYALALMGVMVMDLVLSR